MVELPKDPMMLLSWVNMKLRDAYPSLDLLCEDMQIDKSQLMDVLSRAGFAYDAEHNRFW